MLRVTSRERGATTERSERCDVAAMRCSSAHLQVQRPTLRISTDALRCVYSESFGSSHSSFVAAAFGWIHRRLLRVESDPIRSPAVSLAMLHKHSSRRSQSSARSLDRRKTTSSSGSSSSRGCGWLRSLQRSAKARWILALVAFVALTFTCVVLWRGARTVDLSGRSLEAISEGTLSRQQQVVEIKHPHKTVAPEPPAAAAPVPTAATPSPAAPPASRPSSSTRKVGVIGNFDEFRMLLAPTSVQVPLASEGSIIASVKSPRQAVELTLFLDARGALGYRLNNADSGASILLDSSLDLKLDSKACGFRAIKTKNAGGSGSGSGVEEMRVRYSVSEGRSIWAAPHGFERSVYREEFTLLSAWCEGAACQHCEWKAEFRVFEQTLAIRTLVSGDSMPPRRGATAEEAQWAQVLYNVHVGLPRVYGTQCWASQGASAFQGQPCHDLSSPMSVPLTVLLPSSEAEKYQIGAYAITQTAGVGFQPSGVVFQKARSDDSTTTLSVVSVGEARRGATVAHVNAVGDLLLDDHLGLVTATCWHVTVWGSDAKELLEVSAPIRLLAAPTPPTLHEAFANVHEWMRPGKMLRLSRGAFDTRAAMKLIDYATLHHYEWIHLDRGWDEHAQVAGGRSSSLTTAKDHPRLDIKSLVAYAHAKTPRVGVSLHLNASSLRAAEFPQWVHQLSEEWGVDGVRIGGFVHHPTNASAVYASSAMRILHEAVAAFAVRRISVSVDDDHYRPRSLCRTLPNLLAQTSLPTEDHRPSCTSHTVVPFVRGLAGASDYAPRYATGSPRCTRAHQLALPIVYFSPMQRMFWGEELQTLQDVYGAAGQHGELRFWEQMPTVWDDTRILGGSMGEWISVGRRSGDSWYVASLNSASLERKLDLDLRPLFDAVHADAPSHHHGVWQHPPLPPLPDDGFVVEIWADQSWTELPPLTTDAAASGARHDDSEVGVHDRDWNKLKVQDVSYLYLPSRSIRTLLLGDRAVEWSSLSPSLLTWTAERSVAMFTVSSFVVPAFLAPSGGHCVRIMPAKSFLAEVED